MGRLGCIGVGGVQHRAPRTKLARIAAEEFKIAYTLKDLLLKEAKKALFTDLGA